MEHPYNPPKTDQALCQAIQENIAYIQTFPPQRLMVMLQPSLLEASLAERTARFQYPIQDWMLNAVNIVHGGVISSIFDNGMALLLRRYTDRDCRTLNLQVSYAAPIPLKAGHVTLQCKIQALSHRVAHMWAGAYINHDPMPAATATSIFYMLK